jgi:hypothetical protein
MRMTALVKEIFDGVEAWLAPTIAGIEQRLAAVEDRPAPREGKDGAPGRDGKDGEPGPRGDKGDPGQDGADGKDGRDGKDGKSITVDDVMPMMEAAFAKWALEFERRSMDMVQRAIDRLPVPKDGKDGEPGQRGEQGLPGRDGRDFDPDVLRAAAREEAAAEVAAIPRPADGKSVTVDDVRPLIEGEVKRLAEQHKAEALAVVQRAVEAIPVPRDGKDADMDAVRVMVREEALQAVKAIPVPRDGKDADPEAVRLAVREEVSRAVAALPPPQPGKDADAVAIAKDVLDMVMKSLPAVKDGRDGKDGESITPEDVQPLVEAEVSRRLLEIERRATEVAQRAVDKAPKPKDGADGFTPDDLEISLEDRTLTITLCAGERRVQRQVHLPGMMVYRGVYAPGKAYAQGDAVTYGGSVWVAKRDTGQPPKGAGDDWQLGVKGTR